VPLLYYISDRRQFPGDEREQRRRLLDKIEEAAGAGVDFIQLREKDLPARQLEQLAVEAAARIRRASRPATRLLINSRSDVALAAGADGVHLTATDISAADARALWAKASPRPPLIAVSCHTAAEIAAAASQGADFTVFGPVFEKGGRAGVGLESLRGACALPGPATGVEVTPAMRFPVLALGGVTLENARECLRAGAAGIAGIRIFQQQDLAAAVDGFRKLSV
jgi:thiamine-phosphate pyrophosphorylase